MVKASGNKATTVAAMSLAVMIAIVGCAPRNIAFDVERSDLLGTWTVAVDGKSLRLEMFEDGTYQADDWPENLVCTADGAETVSELDWGITVDAHGTWEPFSSSGSGNSTLAFFPADSRCARDGWYSHVWVNRSDHLSQNIFLDGLVDADTAEDDQIFWLEKVD